MFILVVYHNPIRARDGRLYAIGIYPRTYLPTLLNTFKNVAMWTDAPQGVTPATPLPFISE